MTPEDITFLREGEEWPHDRERIRKYEDYRKLFIGSHEQIDGWKAAFNIIQREDKHLIHVLHDLPKAIPKLFADLLVGETPNITAENEEDQSWLDDFIERNKLYRLIHKGVHSQSYRGDAVLKLSLVDGKAKLSLVPASYWFPIVDESDVTEFKGHVFAWVIRRGDVEYLRAEIHLPGYVYQRAFNLVGGRIGSRVDVKSLGIDLEEDMPTGIEEMLVAVVPNRELDDSTFGLSDYEGIDSLFQQLDMRLSQIAKILDKHSAPGMYGPAIMNTDPETGEVQPHRTDAYIEIPDGGVTPGYLTWDANLDANWTYLEKILDAIFIATGTNRASFGLLDGTNALSGSALKKILMRTLQEVNNKRIKWDEALKYIIPLAGKLERANNVAAPEDLVLQIEWRDGLPNDPKEDAEIEAIRTGGKATSSVWSAIRRLDGGTPKSIEEEIKQIEAEEEPAPIMTQTIMPNWLEGLEGGGE